MAFLDELRREWELMSCSIADTGTELAEEAGLDFDGTHKRRETTPPDKKNQPKGMVSAFVNGWYSARNSCAAQGRHGHQLGPNFGGFENFGPTGPEMEM